MVLNLNLQHFCNLRTGWCRKIYTPIFPNISVIRKDIELIFCTDIREHVDIQATVAPLDMTSLCLHHSLETQDCWEARAPHGTFVKVGPGGLKVPLQIGGAAVGRCADIRLQDGPGCKVHWVQVRAGGWPHVLVAEVSHVGPAPLLGHFRCVRRRTILYKDVAV